MKRFLALFSLLLCVYTSLFGQNHIDKKTDNELLYNLCKVWGFLKYHHPAVISGEHDWDKELFAMFDKFETVENDGQRNNLLMEWVGKLGPVTIGKVNNPASFKQINNLEWINPQVLGEKLSAQLKDIRYAARPDSNYYFSFHPQLGIPVFNNEKTYSGIDPWNDVHYRFLTLCRAWNVIEYLYPYKYLTDKPWDSVLREYIPLFISADSKKEYLKVLSSFSAGICDSHTSLYNSRFSVSQELFGITGGYKKSMPYLMEYIENKYVVTASFQDDKSIQAGDIITAIDYSDIDSLAKAMRPYTAASNEGGYHDGICHRFSMTDKDSVVLTIVRDNRQTNVSVPTLDRKDFYLKINGHFGDAVKIIDGNIGYINIAGFPASDIPATMGKMSEVKGLILDLRDYPAEFIAYKLGAYLIGNDTPLIRFAFTGFDHLGTFDGSRIIKMESSESNQFKNKIILLVNSSTMSRGEFMAMVWSTAPNAIALGSQTAGADGEVSALALPGDFHLTFTGHGIYYPDGGETQRIGVRIDEELRPTIRGIREGRDELLERAIEMIK